MLRRCLLLAGLVCVVRLSGAAAQPDDKAASRKGPPAVDFYGDPLPPGAVARLGTVRFRRRSDHYLEAIAFLPDNKTLLTVDWERVQFWDFKTGRLLREISAGPWSLRSFALSKDATRFAVAAVDSADRAEIRIYDTASGKPLRTLPRANSREFDRVQLAFSPDGKLLFSLAEWNALLRVEEVDSGKEKLQRQFPKGDVHGLAMAPDGEYVAIARGLNNKQLFLWKWHAQEPRLVPSPEGVERMAFSPDGMFLAVVARFSNRVHMLEVPSGRVAYQRDFPDHPRSDVWMPLFTPDGKTLLVSLHQAAASEWRTELLNPETRESRGAVPGGAKMAVSPDSRFLASGVGRAVRIVDLKTLQDVSPTDAAHMTAPSRIRVSPRGVVVTAGGPGLYGSDNTVRIWDAVSGKQRRVIRLDGWVRDIALSGDGRLLAASCCDDTVRLFALNDAREIYRLPGHGKVGGGDGATVAFAPDGRSFISWGDDFYLRRWDVKTGRALLEHHLRPDVMPDPRLQALGHTPANAVALPDAKTLLVNVYGQYHFFDIASGKELRKVAHESGFGSMAVSPNGKYLVATYWGNAQESAHAVLHELASGDRTRIALPGTVGGPVAFSPDSRSFATSTHAPDEIRIFETASLKERHRIRSVPSRVWSLAFFPDGRRLASGHSDSTVLIWDLTAPRKE